MLVSGVSRLTWSHVRDNLSLTTSCLPAFFVPLSVFMNLPFMGVSHFEIERIIHVIHDEQVECNCCWRDYNIVLIIPISWNPNKLVHNCDFGVIVFSRFGRPWVSNIGLNFFWFTSMNMIKENLVSIKIIPEEIDRFVKEIAESHCNHFIWSKRSEILVNGYNFMIIGRLGNEYRLATNWNLIVVAFINTSCTPWMSSESHLNEGLSWEDRIPIWDFISRIIMPPHLNWRA